MSKIMIKIKFENGKLYVNDKNVSDCYNITNIDIKDVTLVINGDVCGNINTKKDIIVNGDVVGNLQTGRDVTINGDHL